ncbi:MAG: hypothetical protein WD052_08695 [Bacteroidales bacterium]
MKKVTNWLFLSCLKASELIEKKIHFRLSLKEKLQLKIHKMMCEACTSYERQSVFLEKGISLLKQKDISTEELHHLKLAINEKLSELNG